jgi:deazaflavin-dependent oxidoreductase (nitroreductase family)
MDIKETNQRVIEQFRAGGEIDGMHRERLLLLTTTGARTGQSRTTPLMLHRDGDRLLVIASYMGAPAHPDWYLNLAADPRVTVEVGDETYEATAVTVVGEERATMWRTLTESHPFLADHQATTDRTIPVVALTRT